jgi:UDP-3-O-[3-hydroxymyristoyl] glucosamine N-acyltransferase
MDAPYRGFAAALALFYPDALLPKSAMTQTGDPLVHPSAQLESGTQIEPGAVVGREAEIGRGTRIAAGAVIGYRVTIGRGCYIGPDASVTHALVGDRVILHAGVRIGQDGFGFAMGPRGHLKVPQIGRVIIQDDVEIGANSCVDRGALSDTIIGEGTKIDNLVQIGHNVVVGRHCVIVAQVGISGSTELGDFVVMGGHSGAVGHIKIGLGAQIAGAAHVKDDVPPGARMGGTPAVPLVEYGRQLAILKRLARKGGRSGEG